MKKNLILALIALFAVCLLVSQVDIQSVDEYYLTHIEDITPESETVFLSIRCDAVFDHYDQLDPALKKEGALPEDGVILERSEYVLRPGDTVFDLLHRATRYHKIQMEYTGAGQGGYGSVYIEGIRHLYEFSCGPQSGWVYLVNGASVSRGCSNYPLRDGDVVEWVYTCAANEAG